jgi:hypothetical protein
LAHNTVIADSVLDNQPSDSQADVAVPSKPKKRASIANIVSAKLAGSKINENALAIAAAKSEAAEKEHQLLLEKRRQQTLNIRVCRGRLEAGHATYEVFAFRLQ